MITASEAARIEEMLAALRRAHGAAGSDAFLAGPDGRPEDIDIDPLFAKELATVLRELAEDLGGPVLDARWCREAVAGGEGRPAGKDLWIVSPRDAHGIAFGSVAVHLAEGGAGCIVGAYGGCDLAVDPAWRRRGIGKALVVDRALRDGWIPVWSLDTPSYTPEGAAVHAAALTEIERLKEMAAAGEPVGTPEP